LDIRDEGEYCKYDDMGIASWFLSEQLINSEYHLFNENFEQSGFWFISKDVATFNDCGNLIGVCEHWVLPDYVAHTLCRESKVELVRHWFDMET